MLPGAWVCFLSGELRSCMPCHMPPRPPKKKRLSVTKSVTLNPRYSPNNYQCLGLTQTD